MQVKHHTPILLVLLLLAACTNQPSPESFATQQPSPSPEINTFTSTPKIIDITPTHTLIPAVTVQILPTQIPTRVNLENLPNLRETILSAIDFETIGLGYNTLTFVTDATNELQDSCLWDCAKYRYSLEYGTLTIMLLRAGDHQKAENTLENLRKDFLDTVVAYEYTPEDAPIMPPGSWVIVDQAIRTEDYQTGAAGITHGSIVVLVTYRQIGSDDLAEFAIVPTYFLNEQIRKLESAGYPK